MQELPAEYKQPLSGQVDLTNKVQDPKTGHWVEKDSDEPPAVKKSS